MLSNMTSNDITFHSPNLFLSDERAGLRFVEVLLYKMMVKQQLSMFLLLTTEGSLRLIVNQYNGGDVLSLRVSIIG